MSKIANKLTALFLLSLPCILLIIGFCSLFAGQDIIGDDPPEIIYGLTTYFMGWICILGANVVLVTLLSLSMVRRIKQLEANE